jgi:hypothetical protein
MPKAKVMKTKPGKTRGLSVLLSAFSVFLRTPSVYIKTYGCQMNERDSEAVAAPNRRLA